MTKINFMCLIFRKLIKNKKIIIEALLRKCNLLDRYSDISFKNNLYNFLQQKDHFLQRSYFESFTNSVLESCVVGTPVLVFESQGGQKQIIENGINCHVVEDESEFIQKINDLLFQEEWNPINVKKTVVEKFNKGYILGQYEQLFSKLANS